MVVGIHVIYMQETALKMVQSIEEDGMIEPETELDIDVSIDLRQDELQMFETESGELLLTTPEMDAYISPTPTASGVVTEVIVQPESTLQPIEPAEPEDSPEMDTWAVAETEIRTD